MAAEAAGLTGSITAHAGDVSTEPGVRSIVSGAVDTLGSLDVLVNVAGILSFSHSHEVTLDEWNRLITVNLTGTFLMCRESIPHLFATKGNIVNLASTAVPRRTALGARLLGHQGWRAGHDPRTRHRVRRAGLRCNSVSPGAIDTPITRPSGCPRGPTPN